MGLFNIIISGNFNITNLIIYVLSSSAVVFLTLPIHEFAHAYAAYKLGDNTAKYTGRLTVNPLAHIDYIGAVCILLFGFGWAKPVPVNTLRFKRPKRDMALTALAGPVSNIIVAFVSLFLFNLLYFLTGTFKLDFLYYIAIFFFFVAEINASLAVFNLIPIPPLDGSRLLSAFLPYKYYYALMRYEKYIFYLLLALIWFGVFDKPLMFLTNSLINSFMFITSLPFGLG